MAATRKCTLTIDLAGRRVLLQPSASAAPASAGSNKEETKGPVESTVALPLVEDPRMFVNPFFLSVADAPVYVAPSAPSTPPPSAADKSKRPTNAKPTERPNTNQRRRQRLQDGFDSIE